jgi:O-glycosyl hydrolase
MSNTVKALVVSFRLSSFLGVFTLLSITPALSMTGEIQVKVDPGNALQVHEGFGTSLAWWGHVIGGWPKDQREHIADLVFHPEKGLGFNIVRYNIGGGDNPALEPYLRPGGDVPGFQPEPGVWDWSADANQRWVLFAARERAGKEFLAEAFSNSPPYWMNFTNDVHGNQGSDNLKPEYYDAFADYLTEVVKHFRDEYGLTFRTLAPFNEPELAWGSPSHRGQEGAHFSVATQQVIIGKVADALRAKGLDTAISAMDGAHYRNTIRQFNGYSDDTRARVAQINSHGYEVDSGAMRDLRTLAAREGKRLWMSELDGGGGRSSWGSFPHNPEDMVPALNLSRQVYQTLKDLQPAAWIFWQAVENWAHNIDANHNWGLIHANFQGEGVQGLGEFDYTFGKKFYTMAQYSRFIRPGDTQIQIDQARAVAFVNQEQGRLVIVQTNEGDEAISYKYDFSPLMTGEVAVEVYRTSPSENLLRLPDIGISAEGQFAAAAAPRSVTTYVLTGIRNPEARDRLP